HIAPGHGQEDYEVGIKFKLPVISPVDNKGRFTAEVKEYEGINVFKANKEIIHKMSETGSLCYTEPLEHSYPHCWRCKKPVIFRATPQWFIRIDKNNFRNKVLSAISSVSWVPKTGENRISGMIQSRPDWCISRQRLWGVPIPVFYCSKCQKSLLDVEIIERVRIIISKHGADAWFEKDAGEFIPKETVCANCGNNNFLKENDILDVWFESGGSHQAVLEERDDLTFPADLYLEGSDQHRGWFQSSLLIGMAVTEQVPFKTVLTHGFVVDGDGKKMSKSVGNVISPQEIMKTYGADILRLWVFSVDFSDDVRISNDIIKQMADAYRRIRNTFRFLLGNLNGFKPEQSIDNIEDMTSIDKWVLHKTNQLIKEVSECYDSFDFYQAFHKIHNYCAVDLSSFYLDILKDRLYADSVDSSERRSTCTALYNITEVLNRLIAPVLSFTSEEIWRLRHDNNSMSESVHLSSWPTITSEWDNFELVQEWDVIISVRDEILRVIEDKRRDKIIGSSLECQVALYVADERINNILDKYKEELELIFIISEISVNKIEYENVPKDAVKGQALEDIYISVSRTRGKKCPRCWKYTKTMNASSLHPELCARCLKIVSVFDFE
ncbi:MAG: class I tRNA ligase family protein, partial [Candidatus Theseobacter exili]|nr:class I tRNA ligase family protein [Candidatus Theseobacter exili]